MFKGLKHSEKRDAAESMKNFCLNMLGARCDININRTYYLVRKESGSPINAHIPNDLDLIIFKKCKHTSKYTLRDT